MLVHQGTEEQAEAFLGRFGMAQMDRISDPERELYKAFELGAKPRLLSATVFLRSIEAMQYGGGKVIGDTRQMPGAFVLYRGEVVRSFVHQLISDRPDYVALVEGIIQPDDDDE